MKRPGLAARLGRRGLRLLTYAVVLSLAVFATVVIVFAVQARLRLPDLKPWHRMVLSEEFDARRKPALADFAEYRALEARLFAEFQRRILDDPAVADHHVIGRYNPGSLPARIARDTPYNRSWELVPGEIRGGALLVHGLSDAPYSMRALAEHLHGLGFYVLVLRLPGHGTVPAALRDVTWEDWYAATALAARHVATRVGTDRPFYAVGYSTGAPLALLHTLRALDGSGERAPDRLVLMSPAIGLAPFAALTNFAAALSFVPWFEKADWLDVLPEFDPFKFNSFPVNAANQIWRLTRVLEDEMSQAQATGRLERFPPVLAFQSLVDATVSTADVFERLFMRLPARGHELVVFGVNTAEGWDALIAEGPIKAYREISRAPGLPFRLALVANRSDRSPSVAEYWRQPLSREAGSTDLPARWPAGVLSLGHIALPFPVDDPLYGLEPKDGGLMGYAMGNVATRGESGAMAVPLGSLARIHSNPFFDVVRGRVSAAVEADRARR